MNTYDFENMIYPFGLALSPAIVLARHQAVINKYGIDNFLQEKEFKRAREMYQTAIYAIGTTARNRIYYWVTPAKPKDETPDCYLIWVNGNELCIECVEITLWNEHVDEMWEIIQKKISKNYPENFSIVIHDSSGKKFVSSVYYQALHEKLKSYSISAGAVRFWVEITNKKDRDVLIGELYPENTWTEFSSAHFLSKYPLAPEIVKIDVTTKPKRIVFNHNDLNGLTLPDLPEYNCRKK